MQPSGDRYIERRSYDVLFNGFAVEINPADRMKWRNCPESRRSIRLK